ncbi:MAG: hypothetical protein ACI85I_001172 [Arenicella sp.]|jgi:hypothetical protein
MEKSKKRIEKEFENVQMCKFAQKNCHKLSSSQGLEFEEVSLGKFKADFEIKSLKAITSSCSK